MTSGLTIFHWKATNNPLSRTVPETNYFKLTNPTSPGHILPYLGGSVLGESVRIRREHEVQEAD